MYAVTGITGQVGGAVATRLLEAGQAVRAIVRNEARGGPWAERGCAVALAEMTDADALAAAFEGAEAAFIVIPPMFDPAPGFPEVRAVIAALTEALARARPARVVCLSTIGAQAAEPNLLSQLGLVERALGGLSMPVAFLRAAWFMENAAGDLAAARAGLVPSHLQPLDRPVPMVAVADIARVAAETMRASWSGVRVVELEGPRRVSPNDLASAFSDALGHQVRVEAVPREIWETSFRAAGARNPGPRARMIDGFNAGWIAFEGVPLKGATEIDAVIRRIVGRAW
ncbi:NAD(P)H dehydrogenase (quinone) [Methylobacterium sp. PvP062]|uniref:Uncharacterized protein YbjT (DUF2867 family) n=1 Tax=Methylobacterium radiotolerans TaxID=31998 RepID=A0ABV2NKX1_9HYPH|nr:MULTISPECIES: NmrA family NAD(P)-binding protein [unclassified Methylobacterium]MBP2496144.1 uncharacterized protein YbjT (DUF2867 family) [Methylobacterium sp. PvP105]MBP2503984.1 uncharacterized protein YbjT (DUF2867 family) [Methylobacterium sp. PvP109]MCX7335547.1 NAD(P)H-binding protein [Hyphomicrobiales bacterium]